MIDFKEDPLFKQVRQLFFRFSSRYSLELERRKKHDSFCFSNHNVGLTRISF